MRRVRLREIYNFESTNFRLQISGQHSHRLAELGLDPVFHGWRNLADSGEDTRNETWNLRQVYVWGLWVLCALFMLSHVQLFVTPWTIAHQAPLSMGFSGQEHWSGLPYSPSGDLPDPWTEPASLMSPALAGRFFTTSATYISRLFGS